jgi:hypothetical protein
MVNSACSSAGLDHVFIYSVEINVHVGLVIHGVDSE